MGTGSGSILGRLFPPGGRDEFARMVMRATAAAIGISEHALIYDPERFQLRTDSSDGVMDLHKAYEEYCQAPFWTRSARLAAYVEATLIAFDWAPYTIRPGTHGHILCDSLRIHGRGIPLIPAATLLQQDAQVRHHMMLQRVYEWIDPDDELCGQPLRFYLLLTHWPHLLGDSVGRLSKTVLFYNQYYWFLSFSRLWQARHGTDAQLQQQVASMQDEAQGYGAVLEPEVMVKIEQRVEAELQQTLSKLPAEVLKPRPTFPTRAGTYESGEWTYVHSIGYRGTRSESRQGLLFRNREPILGKPGDILDTPLGRFAFFDTPYHQGWLNTLPCDGDPDAVFNDDGTLSLRALRALHKTNHWCSLPLTDATTRELFLHAFELYRSDGTCNIKCDQCHEPITFEQHRRHDHWWNHHCPCGKYKGSTSER